MSWLSSMFGGGKSSAPSYNPQAALGYASQLFNQAANQGIDFSKRGTEANISNQNVVTPGSSAQRQAALNQINQYIQGQVPLDVQQNTQRAIAQSFGGGYNPFTGGGQAPSAFARNIGQTSVGLSQFGLSAAPTWQQLANQMVVNPAVGLSAGLNAGQQGLASAENQYVSQQNQYLAQQQQQQQAFNNILALGSTAAGIYSGVNTGNYLNSLVSPQQGTSRYANQFGSDMMSSSGFYETPAAVQAAFGRGAIPAYYSGGGQSGYYNQGFQ